MYFLDISFGFEHRKSVLHNIECSRFIPYSQVSFQLFHWFRNFFNTIHNVSFVGFRLMRNFVPVNLLRFRLTKDRIAFPFLLDCNVFTPIQLNS